MEEKKIGTWQENKGNSAALYLREGISPKLVPTHEDLLRAERTYFWPPQLALHLARKEAETDDEFHKMLAVCVFACLASLSSSFGNNCLVSFRKLLLSPSAAPNGGWLVCPFNNGAFAGPLQRALSSWGRRKQGLPRSSLLHGKRARLKMKLSRAGGAKERPVCGHTDLSPDLIDWSWEYPSPRDLLVT